MRFRIPAMIGALLFGLVCNVSRIAAAEENPLLVQWPTMSKTQIVFVYGGYLWSVPRDGGEARQLTTGGMRADQNFLPMEAGSRLAASTTVTSTLM